MEINKDNLENVTLASEIQNGIDRTEEPLQERKITQTDHVNKKLLQSFLERINQNDNTVAFGLNIGVRNPEEELENTDDDFELTEDNSVNSEAEDQKDSNSNKDSAVD